jgi:hypothetical protein
MGSSNNALTKAFKLEKIDQLSIEAVSHQKSREIEDCKRSDFKTRACH